MSKLLTKKGESFIREICKGSGNTLLSGKNKFPLPFSENQNDPNIIYTSNAKNELGVPITSNKELAEALIYWFNFYSNKFKLDANVIAAQAYDESSYKLWDYDNKSTKCGISKILSKWVYRFILNRGGSFSGGFFSDEEKDRITKNIENPYEILSYEYNGEITTEYSVEIAINNRLQLYQNMIDNLDIMIRAQCSIMKKLLDDNGSLLSNALFAYKIGVSLTGKTYPEIINNAADKFSDNYILHGSDYVQRIYRYLGDLNNDKVIGKIKKPKGFSFGYDIDFTFDEFTANLA